MSRSPQPPGAVESVSARSVLVVAPHRDDEVLGCGGLLAQLAASGASIRVLFLTDSAGGPDHPEAVPDASQQASGSYSATRFREAEGALAKLGLARESIERLDLPDGGLDQAIGDLGAGILSALLEVEADLLLVPSPLEVTADHRATFAALHRILGAVRSGPESQAQVDIAGAMILPSAIVRSLAILAYEVNHPGYPDLLVDVSDQIDAISAAMGCYESQQERHDYLAAGLGLRRFRTLSLPKDVAAAEGYRRLSVNDFVTRSPTQLVRYLGGEPTLLKVDEGPKISVIVRTKDRPELLAEALGSLAESTYRRAEVLVVNDGGKRPKLPSPYPLPIRLVDLERNLGRAGAANAGLRQAEGEYVAFLDDDDLVAPEHLAVLAGAVAGSGVGVAYSDAAVVVYELATAADDADRASGWQEVERRLPYSRDFDPDVLLVDNYIPFNTLLVERGLFEASTGADLPGPFDPDLPFFEDWDFLIRLAGQTPFHHVRRVTCEYRHFRGGGHHILGESPRKRADFLDMKRRVLTRHADRLTAERLARAVDTLRAETVDAAEEAVSARRSEEAARSEARDLADRFHRLNGSFAALTEERDRLEEAVDQRGAALERLQSEESALRTTIDEQSEHLERTYAEIARLGEILETLGDASLPGLVRWWRTQRKKANGVSEGSEAGKATEDSGSTDG